MYEVLELSCCVQASGVYLSDIPRYDLSSDYILLAEQRQAEADLKEKYERLTMELQVSLRTGVSTSTNTLVMLHTWNV